MILNSISYLIILRLDFLQDLWFYIKCLIDIRNMNNTSKKKLIHIFFIILCSCNYKKEMFMNSKMRKIHSKNINGNYNNNLQKNRYSHFSNPYKQRFFIIFIGLALIVYYLDIKTTFYMSYFDFPSNIQNNNSDIIKEDNNLLIFSTITYSAKNLTENWISSLKKNDFDRNFFLISLDPKIYNTSKSWPKKFSLKQNIKHNYSYFFDFNLSYNFENNMYKFLSSEYGNIVKIRPLGSVI
ncbi:MAG: hypothetical protein GY830_08430 [Bacteroidetes bacterium]|nr:hypothetical protein [Bacteroidota bacterium]